MFGTMVTRMALPNNAGLQVRRPRHLQDRRPSVSVIIPCYNYGRYLLECVDSVLGQDGVVVNIIIVDDASPDGSAEVVRKLAEEDERISAIFHAENRGHIATYNDGLAQASGKYVVMLSADDRLTPGSLARATSLMEECPSVGLTYGFAVDFTDTHLPSARTEASKWIIWEGHDWLSHRCRTGHNVIRSPEVVLRTSAFREVGGAYQAHLPHTADFELWMRIAAISDIAYIVGADQAYYRLHQNNMHHTKFDLLGDISGRLQAFESVFADYSDRLTDASALLSMAHRCLAVESLRHAMSVYTRGLADQQQIAKYADFAVATYPEVQQLRAWRTLSSVGREGYRHPRMRPALASREKVRNLQYSLNWWRWRWTGVY